MNSTTKQREIIFPCVKPIWPAPPSIHAYTTVRSDGFSRSPYDSFNLSQHVGDDPLAVSVNRAKLTLVLKLPTDPIWLQQAHSNKVVPAHEITAGTQADASYTDQFNVVCAILTADCLPLLLTDRQGSKVAAIHAGWRGLAAGVIDATVRELHIPGNELLAWLGPTISAEHYEVGNEVRDAFVQQHAEAKAAFTGTTQNKWQADLYLLARQCLNRLGVNQIYGGEFCTYTHQNFFFSHRRDQGITGRMATLIWKI
ncbi:MAG: peptidoglycan editing factor PgeF [Gammaproteobacteria bacterium]